MIDAGYQYIAALTGDANTVMDFRCIHDVNLGIPAHNHRGTLGEKYNILRQYNEAGYGVFVAMNVMDGFGTSIPNVTSIRAQMADIDGNPQGTMTALNWFLKPSFFVNTSPGKQHFYWLTNPYLDVQLFEDNQRRLITMLGSDPAVVDPARHPRLPGFFHRKAEPFMITGQGVSGTRYHVQVLQAALSAYTPYAANGGTGERKPLGTPSLAAPSIEWLRYALAQIDPNELDRYEWISLLAAVKQSGWSLTDENSLYSIFAEWCARYTRNNPQENLKQWNSVKQTERGWSGLARRSGILPLLYLGNRTAEHVSPGVVSETASINVGGASDMLDTNQQIEYFKGCIYVANEGRIRTSDGSTMDANRFNARYGGPIFILNSQGKCTDEAWKAVTRNQLWKIPIVNRMRFLPKFEPNTIHTDEFGRTSVNSYIRPRIDAVQGDISRFTDHMARILPVQRDREIFYDFMTWNVQKPGVKLPWAAVLQSAEGVGKDAIYMIMCHALGGDYVYKPKAEMLADSGGKFNAWMENRLLIVANEIRVGEKYHLMEVLKPLITDDEIEIEGKGANQYKGDNPANWLMFTNYRDAIIVNDNSRRYAIFFSVLQTYAQMLAAGMDEAYYTALFDWLRGAGKSHIAYWLQHRPLSEYFKFARAPITSSMPDAINISKSSIQMLIEGAVAAAEPGFRGGWVSTKRITALAGEAGIRVETRSMSKTLEGMGYYQVGPTWKGVDRGAMLWHKDVNVKTTFDYDVAQFLTNGV